MLRDVERGIRPHSIEIPVRGGEEVVEVFLDDLPQDAAEIEAILQEEGASLELYHKFGLEYWRRGNFLGCEKLLSCGFELCKSLGIFSSTQNIDLISESTNQKESAIRLITSLAALRIRQGKLEDSAALLNKAESLDSSNINILVRKGLYMLADGMVAQAEYQARVVIAREPENVEAKCLLLATSAIAERWNDSIKYSEGIFESQGAVARSLCLNRLGLDDEAIGLLEQDITFDAQVIKAAIFYNGKNLGLGLSMLKELYEKEIKNMPTPPSSAYFVCCLLADHLCIKGQLQKAAALSDTSLRLINQVFGESDLEAVVGNSANRLCTRSVAQAFYVRGKIAHLEEDYEIAYEKYNVVVKIDPGLLVSQVGLARVFIARGQLQSALVCLEQVFGTSSNNPDVKSLIDSDGEILAMAGTVALNVGRIDLGKTWLLQAKGKVDTFDFHMALSSVLPADDPRLLECLERCSCLDAERFRSNEAMVKNYAVALHISGRYDESMALFNSMSTNDEISKFNKARVLESMKNNTCESIYKELYGTRLHSNAAVRIASIQYSKGHFSDAMDAFKEAIGADDSCCYAWCGLAKCHLKMKAIAPGRKTLERVLKQYDSHDRRAINALGCLYIGEAQRSSDTIMYARRATEFFVKALTLDDRDFVAAAGVGICLMLIGNKFEGKDVLQQVWSAVSSSTFRSTLNIDIEREVFSSIGMAYGHALFACKQVNTSIFVYKNIVDKYNSSDALCALSRALYVQSLEYYSSNAFSESCKSALSAFKCLIQIEDSEEIIFNRAICLLEIANSWSKCEGKVIDFDDSLSGKVSNALDLLEVVEGLFTDLANKLDKKKESERMNALIKKRKSYLESLRLKISEKMKRESTKASWIASRLEAVREGREQQRHSEREDINS